MKTRTYPIEAEVKTAIKKFISQGGFIHRLPFEKRICPNMVGSRFGMYENPLHELNASNTTC